MLSTKGTKYLTSQREDIFEEVGNEYRIKINEMEAKLKGERDKKIVELTKGINENLELLGERYNKASSVIKEATEAKSLLNRKNEFEKHRIRVHKEIKELDLKDGTKSGYNLKEKVISEGDNHLMVEITELTPRYYCKELKLYFAFHNKPFQKWHYDSNGYFTKVISQGMKGVVEEAYKRNGKKEMESALKTIAPYEEEALHLIQKFREEDYEVLSKGVELTDLEAPIVFVQTRKKWEKDKDYKIEYRVYNSILLKEKESNERGGGFRVGEKEFYCVGRIENLVYTPFDIEERSSRGRDKFTRENIERNKDHYLEIEWVRPELLEV
jgi:hypothetical protein